MKALYLTSLRTLTKLLLLLSMDLCLLSCGVQKRQCEGEVLSKYTITEGDERHYIVSLASKKNETITVETNRKTWVLLEVGQYIVMKKY